MTIEPNTNQLKHILVNIAYNEKTNPNNNSNPCYKRYCLYAVQ